MGMIMVLYFFVVFCCGNGVAFVVWLVNATPSQLLLIIRDITVGVEGIVKDFSDSVFSVSTLLCL
jgi:hypothetical protein